MIKQIRKIFLLSLMIVFNSCTPFAEIISATITAPGMLIEGVARDLTAKSTPTPTPSKIKK